MGQSELTRPSKEARTAPKRWRQNGRVRAKEWAKRRVTRRAIEENEARRIGHCSVAENLSVAAPAGWGEQNVRRTIKEIESAIKPYEMTAASATRLWASYGTKQHHGEGRKTMGPGHCTGGREVRKPCKNTGSREDAGRPGRRAGGVPKGGGKTDWTRWERGKAQKK